MDSQKWSQRGKKLFLPKIEYSRLENSTESWNTPKLSYDSSEEFVVQETIENDDLEKSSSSVLRDRNGISFTKFSVLPPIQGSKASSKGRPIYNRRQLSVDCVVSGEEELYYKRKGSSLHTQTAVLTTDREPITLQKPNTDNPIKIVGKRFSGLNNTTNHQPTMLAIDDRSHGCLGNSPSRPSTTPNASHAHFVCGAKSGRTLSDSENDNRLTSPGLIPQTDPRSGARSSGRRLSKFRRFNSDTSSEGKHESLEGLPANKNVNHSLLSRGNLPQANLLLNPSGSEGNCQGLRPISRCHIDINMNDSENVSLGTMEDRKVRLGDTNELFDTTLSTDVPSSAPLIQISTEPNPSTEDLERHDSQNSPSIQILINSLDSAKEEGLQDEKTEQPKLSVREQRRRSALCRANSKQVDDFLLVHNLRDLGLL